MEICGKIFTEDYMIIRGIEDAKEKVFFYELPRCDMGNSDFVITRVSDNTIDVSGYDGYGAVHSVLFLLEEDEELMSSKLGGIRVMNTDELSFQDVIGLIIWNLDLTLQKEVDMLSQYRILKAAIGEEEWDFLSWSEKLHLMVEMIK